MNYYRHYIGDYQRDTAHLSFVEHGAFRKLLDAYYAADGKLPADDTTLFRVTSAMTPEEQDAVRVVVRQYFTRDGARLSNKRADEELAHGLNAIDIAKRNGKKGGRKPRKNPAGNLEGTQRDTQRVSKTEPSGVPSGKAPHPPSPIPHPVTVTATTSADAGHKTTWLTPFALAWTAKYGGTLPMGQAAKVLKPLCDEHGLETVVEYWRNYISATTAQFASPSKFAATCTSWDGTQRSAKVGNITQGRANLSQWMAEAEQGQTVDDGSEVLPGGF